MANVSEKARQPKTLVPAEDLSAGIEELLQFARERGRAGRAPRAPIRGAAPVRTIREDRPNISELVRAEVASLLEDEVLPAVAPGPGRGILDWELQREVAKKALVGLKLQKLKQLAAEMRLDKRGRSEDVADRIARAYRYDEHEIAQLILDNEEEPEPERGHVDRIFPLAETPDIEAVADRLDLIIGRYVRVGVARWFVFEELDHTAGRLTLVGSLRSYRTFVTSDEVDQESEGAHISATPSEVSVELEIIDGLQALRVRSAAPAPSRAAAKALEVATDCRRLGHLPFTAMSFEGPAGMFAPSTVFMLDLVDNRLPSAGVRDRNLTVARFEIERSEKESESDTARPSLREVRFEGDHLLDSVQACRLIALEGRALVDLSMRVSIHDGDSGVPIRFPIRVGLERDHALVLTGYGRQGPSVSAELHRLLVRAVEDGFAGGVPNKRRLEMLARRIEERAHSGREVDRATMLDDEGDNWGAFEDHET